MKEKRYRRLNHEEHYKLTTWLSQHKDKLLEDRPLYSKAAAWASAELGFGIAPGSLTDAARMMGILWDPAVGTGGLPAGTKSRLAEAEVRLDRYENALAQVQESLDKRSENGRLRIKEVSERLDAVSSNLAILRGLIHHLYNQLGATPPPGCVIPIQTNSQTPVLKEKKP